MIILAWAYLIREKAMTGTPQYTPDEVEVDVDVSYDFDSDIDLNFDLDSDIDSHVDVDVDISVDVNVTGNSASFAIDVEAFGDNAATELNLMALATDNSSSIIATGYAAVGDGKHDGGGGGEEEPPPPPPHLRHHLPHRRRLRPPPPPPEDNFPQWPQDISNVVLYFAADGANDPDDVNDDGYVLVKIDNWPGSGDDDLDNSMDTIMDYLLAQGVIQEGSDFLGAAIKGGVQATAFFADDGDHDADAIPPGAPQIETPPPQGQVPGPQIDFTFDYGAVLA